MFVQAVPEIGVLFPAATFRRQLTQTARALPLARSCLTHLGLAPSWRLELLVCTRKHGPDYLAHLSNYPYLSLPICLYLPAH